MHYFIVTEKNGDRSLVCASDEKALSELIANQDEGFELESYLRLDADTFDRAGFIMCEREVHDEPRDITQLLADRERVVERLQCGHLLAEVYDEKKALADKIEHLEWRLQNAKNTEEKTWRWLLLMATPYFVIPFVLFLNWLFNLAL